MLILHRKRHNPFILQHAGVLTCNIIAIINNKFLLLGLNFRMFMVI